MGEEPIPAPQVPSPGTFEGMAGVPGDGLAGLGDFLGVPGDALRVLRDILFFFRDILGFVGIF